MAIQNVQYFKDKFQTGYVPTRQDYMDWLDSFRSVLNAVPLSDTTGLDALLAAYRKTTDKIAIADIDGLTTFINSLTTNFLTSASAVSQSQVTGLAEALAAYTSASAVQTMIDNAVAAATDSILAAATVNGNNPSYTSISADYTAKDTDSIIYRDGSGGSTITLTLLPPGSNDKRLIRIIVSNGTVNFGGSQPIKLDLTPLTSVTNGSVLLQVINGAWRMIG